PHGAWLQGGLHTPLSLTQRVLMFGCRDTRFWTLRGVESYESATCAQIVRDRDQRIAFPRNGRALYTTRSGLYVGRAVASRESELRAAVLILWGLHHYYPLDDLLSRGLCVGLFARSQLT